MCACLQRRRNALTRPAACMFVAIVRPGPDCVAAATARCGDLLSPGRAGGASRQPALSVPNGMRVTSHPHAACTSPHRHCHHVLRIRRPAACPACSAKQGGQPFAAGAAGGPSERALDVAGEVPCPAAHARFAADLAGHAVHLRAPPFARVTTNQATGCSHLPAEAAAVPAAMGQLGAACGAAAAARCQWSAAASLHETTQASSQPCRPLLFPKAMRIAPQPHAMRPSLPRLLLVTGHTLCMLFLPSNKGSEARGAAVWARAAGGLATGGC